MQLAPRPSALDRDGFVTAFGGVYEHSPWAAEAAFDAGISAADDSVDALHARLRAVVEAAGAQRQLALLRAHPELAGRLAIDGGLTAASRAEQSGAGLDRCTSAEFARFTALNASYRAKFGFPFIVAVKGLTRADILTAFEARVSQDFAAEHRTALDQVHRIARLRLEAMLG